MVTALALGAALVGCRRRSADDVPVASDRGVPATPSALTATAEPPAPAPAARRWRDPMLAHNSEARPEMVHVEPRPLTVTEAVAGPPAVAPTPRNFEGELRAVAGDVPSCVPAAELAALPARVEVELDAVVTGSGVVSSIAARSGQLSPAAIECLRARVSAARLAAPVADAPRSITARLVLERAAPRPEQAR